MPNSKKNTKNITTTLSTPTAKDIDKCPVPTIVVNMSEQNNNTINTLPASKQGILQCLPEMFTDIDIENHNNINDPYINGDLYKSYIFGKSHTHTKHLTFNFNIFLISRNFQSDRAFDMLLK